MLFFRFYHLFKARWINQFAHPWINSKVNANYEIPTQKAKDKKFSTSPGFEPVCYKWAMLTPFHQHSFEFEIKCNVSFSKTGPSPSMIGNCVHSISVGLLHFQQKPSNSKQHYFSLELEVHHLFAQDWPSLRWGWFNNVAVIQ